MRSLSVRLLSTSFALLFAAFAVAQPPIGTNQLGSFALAPGGNWSADLNITSISGTAGANPGYTLFTYGDPGSPNQNLDITATTGNNNTLKIWSAASSNQTLNAVADGFLSTAPASWNILQKEAGATAIIRLEISNGSNTFFALDDQSQLGTYNTRLNAVLATDFSNFYKSAGTPVTAADGIFSYTFSNWDGARYTGMTLNYTPVPEPATMLGLAAVGFGLLGWRRRRRA
jgi:hypothetical protein